MKTVKLGSNGCGKIEDKDVESMKHLLSLGNSISAVAKVFNVMPSTVMYRTDDDFRKKCIAYAKEVWQKKKNNHMMEKKLLTERHVVSGEMGGANSIMDSFAYREKHTALTKEQTDYLKYVYSLGVLSKEEMVKKFNVSDDTIDYHTDPENKRSKKEYDYMRYVVKGYGVSLRWLKNHISCCKSSDGVHLNNKGIKMYKEMYAKGVRVATLLKLFGTTLSGDEQGTEGGSVQTMVFGNKSDSKVAKTEHNYAREYEAMELLRTRKVSLITTPFSFYAVRTEDGKFFDGQDPTEALLLSRKK